MYNAGGSGRGELIAGAKGRPLGVRDAFTGVFVLTAVRGRISTSTHHTDDQFVRLWRMIERLSASDGLALERLAREFSVSLKTVRRDLDKLADVGLELEDVTGPHGRKAWRIKPDPGRPLSFTPDEAAALYFGRQFLEPLAGTVIWDAAGRAFRKIRTALGDTTLAHLEKLAGTVHQTTFGLCDYTSRGDLIDTLMIGLEDRRRVRLFHQSADAKEPTPKDICPLTLLWHRGALYLVAHVGQVSNLSEPRRRADSSAEPSIKHYKIDRCLDAELLPERFTRPPDFDVQEHLAHTFGIFQKDGPPQRVRIRFAPEVARYVQEHRWSQNQKLTKLKDGGLRLELHLTQFEELQAWLLSFGSKAVVESPKKLRDQLREELLRAAKQYESGYRGQGSVKTEILANRPLTQLPDP